MTKFKYWLRWVAVLPGSILAFLLASVLITIPDALMTGLDTKSYPAQFMSSVAGPYAFTWVGSSIAPVGSLITAISLTIIYVLFASVTLILALVYNPTPEVLIWWLIICDIAGLLASIACCIQIRNRERR